MAEIPKLLVELEERFNLAMISNDIDKIAKCITDDWILITPEAGPVSRSRIMEVIQTGRLTHSTMTKVASHAAEAPAEFNAQVRRFIRSVVRDADGKP